MRAFLIEITAKVVLRSDTDPDELPANLYSRLSEHFGNDDDILDLCIEAMPLPPDLSGQGAH
jgi:hypothetical protein